MILNKLRLLKVLQPLRWVSQNRYLAMSGPWFGINKFGFSSQQDTDGIQQAAQPRQQDNQQQALVGQQAQQEQQDAENKDQKQGFLNAQRLQQWDTVVAQHLLLDKFYQSRSDPEYYTKMEQKLIDYEQEIGLSLSRLEQFPLYSKQRRTGSTLKPYILPTNPSEKDLRKLRTNIMINATNRQHAPISNQIIQYFIEKNDIQLLQTLRINGAFAANNTIGMEQCKKIVSTYFKLKSENVEHAQLLLNYIACEFNLQRGQLRTDSLGKDIIDPLLQQFAHLDGSLVNKLKLSWAMAKLDHKNTSQSEVTNQAHSSMCLRYLVRQLKNIKICYQEERDAAFKDRIRKAPKFQRQQLNDQKELHRALLINCGQFCLVPIVNWMINYFPNFQQFHKNTTLLITLLYLLGQQIAPQSNSFKDSKVQSIYYSVIFNMIRNNILFDSNNQQLSQHLFKQVIPSALFTHAREGQIFEVYKERYQKWQKTIQSFKKIKNFSSNSYLDFYISSLDSSSLAKKIYLSIQRGQMLFRTFEYKNPRVHASMAQYQPIFVNIKQNPVPRTKFQQLLNNQQTITQAQFVKSLIGQKYSLVYDYFKKHFKNQLEPFLANSVTQESVSQFSDFQNEDTKAFYILWQFSKILRENSAPQDLKKSYLQVKQYKQRQYQQPKRLFFKQEKRNEGSSWIKKRQNQVNFDGHQKKIKNKDQLTQRQRLQLELENPMFDQVEHIQKIQKPKQYRTRSKEPTMAFGKRDIPDVKIHQHDSINQQQLANLVQTQGREKPKYRNNDRGYQMHDRNKPYKAKFSTLVQKQTDGYQDYKKTLKQMENAKIFNFDNCKTPQEVKNEFESKINLLNQQNYKEVFANNKIPVIRRGERLFKYFFLNTKLQKNHQNSKSVPTKINNLKVKIESQIGLIEKDYSSYLVDCPFMFPFSLNTYISLMQDQLKNYHRKSFKMIVSHRIAFASVLESSKYYIDNRFIQIMCELCLKEKIGITLLEIVYILYTNKMMISESSLEKICSTLYSFNSLRQDAFDFINKFCQVFDLKFKVLYFKSYCMNLIKQKNYIELQLLVNKLLAQLKQKSYRFDSKLSNEDNQLLQKEWKGKQRNRYINQIYELLEFLTENFESEVPEFSSELFDLYLDYKGSKNQLVTNQLNIAIIVYAQDVQKFNEIIQILKEDTSKINIQTLSALIKSMSMYPRKLTEHLERILKMALYQKNYDLKENNLLKLAEIFVRIDKPMIYGTFLQYLIKNSQQPSNQVKSALYKVLNRTQDDQSKQHIFGLLSLIFDRKKMHQRDQLRQTLKTEESKRKALRQLLQGTAKTQVRKSSNNASPQEIIDIAGKGESTDKTNKKKPTGKIQQKKQQVKKGVQIPESQKKNQQQKSISVNKQPEISKISQNTFQSRTKKKQKRARTQQDILAEIKQKSKGNTFDQNVTFTTFQKTSKKFKRNRTLRSFAEHYLIKDATQQVDVKKKNAAKGSDKNQSKGSKNEVKGSKTAKAKISAKK